MNTDPDILIIGTGTAGYTAATACAAGGRRVAVVDDRPYGGTCAMRGCQPKKYLVAAAAVAHLSRQMSRIGISPAAGVDWRALIRSKMAFTSAVPASTEDHFRESGITMLKGAARFATPTEVMVGDHTSVRPGSVVIATGACPVGLGFPGEELVALSDQFLELATLPERIGFVGGGYISLEFAHIARAAGSEVTVLERGKRVLERFEAEVVERVEAAAREFGIRIVTGFEVCGVERRGESLGIRGGADCEGVHEVDLVVHGAGRQANLKHLDLDSGEVRYTARGVEVNQFLQSVSNPRVYAIGDAAGTPLQLATTADREAAVAADNLLGGNRRTVDYANVPSVVFTLPPLAGVGLTEEQARSSGARFRINRGSTASWPSSRRIGQEQGYYKVLIDEENGQLLGAHLFGQGSDEAINMFALAMKHGLSNADLKEVVWAYPTHISDLKRVLD